MAEGRGAIGSFNVSVAASLALYEVRRQRAGQVQGQGKRQGKE
jgi:tRNA(Leu) C34 or U34 (ribose-2'-O)-methylase TrmL